MSFILDALKKSESDRQRQSGPALFEVKVAPPRSRLPPWALALALLLAVNAAVVAWMLLRHPPAHVQGTLAAAPAVAGTTTPSAPVPLPALVPAAAPQSAPTALPAAPAPGAGTAAVAPVTVAPASISVAAGGTATPATAGGAGAEAPNPEDLVPAAEPAPGFGSHVRRGTADGVPLYQDWAAVPGSHVPQLRLDLHVYAARPQDRFVMINMKKLHEGDSLPEGVHVESITPEGAVLSYGGSRFLLPRD